MAPPRGRGGPPRGRGGGPNRGRGGGRGMQIHNLPESWRMILIRLILKVVPLREDGGALLAVGEAKVCLGSRWKWRDNKGH